MSRRRKSMSYVEISDSDDDFVPDSSNEASTESRLKRQRAKRGASVNDSSPYKAVTLEENQDHPVDVDGSDAVVVDENLANERLEQQDDNMSKARQTPGTIIRFALTQHSKLITPPFCLYAKIYVDPMICRFVRTADYPCRFLD